MKRLIDALLFTEVVDGLAAGWQDVVVDYDEAAASDFLRVRSMMTTVPAAGL
jgi:hypothetical protein